LFAALGHERGDFFFRPRAGRPWQAAEKVFVRVIPSEARNLLFAASEEKADSSGKNRPRNDAFGGFFSSLPGLDCYPAHRQQGNVIG
jgi:hypothetical protein